MDKIFTKSYYKGLFLILNNHFAVKIAEENGKIVFGKLTCSFDTFIFNKTGSYKTIRCSSRIFNIF